MDRYILILGLITPIVCAPAYAADTGYPNDSELRSLPEYCQVKLRQKPGDAGYSTWLGILGPDFIHTHHFCAGLNFINRHYKARSAYDKKYYLTAALPEFGYMVTHAAPTYSLMPDVYMNRGVALSKLGRDGEAIVDFQKAIELNPKLPRAYAMVGDYYAERKLTNRALAAITEGLKQAPDSKMLQRRYLELGGKKPFPEPYAPPASEQLDTAQHGSQTSPNQTKGTADTTKETTVQPEVKAAETDPTTSPPTQPIGTSSNPWCRFCPDPVPAKGEAGTLATPGTNP
jgi:tetratricopeptide (TPR) repeat protein